MDGKKGIQPWCASSSTVEDLSRNSGLVQLIQLDLVQANRASCECLVSMLVGDDVNTVSRR